MDLFKLNRHYFELPNRSISQQDLASLFPTILNKHLITLIIDYWSSWILDYLVEYNYPFTNIKDENVDPEFCDDMITYKLFEEGYNISVQDKINVESLIAVSDDINHVEIEVHDLPLSGIYQNNHTKLFIKYVCPKINIKATASLSRCNNELSVINISRYFWNMYPFDGHPRSDLNNYSIFYTKIGDKVIMYDAKKRTGEND